MLYFILLILIIRIPESILDYMQDHWLFSPVVIHVCIRRCNKYLNNCKGTCIDHQQKGVMSPIMFAELVWCVWIFIALVILVSIGQIWTHFNFILPVAVLSLPSLVLQYIRGASRQKVPNVLSKVLD